MKGKIYVLLVCIRLKVFFSIDFCFNAFEFYDLEHMRAMLCCNMPISYDVNLNDLEHQKKLTVTQRHVTCPLLKSPAGR